MFQLKSLPIQPAHALSPFVVTIIAIFCFAFDNQLSHHLAYDRTHLINGEYWRVFTGHFFHTNFTHLLFNTFAIILLWALHGQFYTNKHYILLFIFSASVISSTIYWLDPQMERYVGLSGVLHAFFVWGALHDIKHKDKTGYLLLLGVLLKIVHEQVYGASNDISALIEASVAIDAHLWGAVAGFLYFIFSIKRNSSLEYDKN